MASRRRKQRTRAAAVRPSTWWRRGPWILGGLLLVAVLVWAFYPTHGGTAGATVATTAASPPTFAATIANTTQVPAAALPGMVWIPGGEFSMGANDPPDMDAVGM